MRDDTKNIEHPNYSPSALPYYSPTAPPYVPKDPILKLLETQETRINELQNALKELSGKAEDMECDLEVVKALDTRVADVECDLEVVKSLDTRVEKIECDALCAALS